MTGPLHRRDFIKACGLMPLATLPLHALKKEGGGDRPNVLVLVFDTLSALHTTVAGYPRTTTPNLERFAQKANVYHRCYSGGNFTSPGTASLLTGTYPWSHRALHLHSVVSEDFIEKNLFRTLPEGYHRVAYTHNLLVTSLLHQFRGDIEEWLPTRELCLVDGQYSDILFPGDYNASYWGETLALQAGGIPPSSLYLSAVSRVVRFLHKERLTEQYGQRFPRGIPNLHDLFFILEDAIDWIANRVQAMPNPYLAYFHLLPPHEPYLTRRDFLDRFKDGWMPEPKPRGPFGQGLSYEALVEERRKYDEYLAYADAEFGRLLNSLEHSGILDSTYVIVTSDHGELFERGIRGHITPALYEPVVRVPLIISAPGQAHRQDFLTPVSTIDLLPTILRWVGGSPPDWSEGEILPGFDGGGSAVARDLFVVEAKSNPKRGPLQKASVAMIRGEQKIVSYELGSAEPFYELYDLANDPEERSELSQARPELLRELRGALHARLEALVKES